MPGTLTERSSGLLIPSAAAARSHEHDKGYVLKCMCCGAKFGTDQHEKWVRHVRNCADAHDDEIQAKAAARRAEPLTNISDPERFAYLRRGRR